MVLGTGCAGGIGDPDPTEESAAPPTVAVAPDVAEATANVGIPVDPKILESPPEPRGGGSRDPAEQNPAVDRGVAEALLGAAIDSTGSPPR